MKKDITFIYSDSAERALYQPIIEEAKKRGYTVNLTDNPFEKCYVGIYCQHMNYPQYSKYSVVMLHDIIQGYDRWPDIWFKETWCKYDIGILPNNRWAENWKAVSKYFYARPRKGVYVVGWPKADAINRLASENYKQEFNKKYGLDNRKKTILYAPAWENDNKEDDFVQAALPLDVNIIIKQWDADPEKFPKQVSEVKRMAELHKELPNVTILPPSTNIFEAIAASDILVSEESSTMCEAAMMNIPAVSVSDWLVPDTVPSRYPKCDYDFVTMTRKNELSHCLKQMIDNYTEVKANTTAYAEKTFLNIGRTSSIIMDMVDDLLSGKTIRYQPLEADRYERLTATRYIKYIYGQWKVEVGWNYLRRSVIGRKIWKVAQRINAIRKRALKRVS